MRRIVIVPDQDENTKPALGLGAILLRLALSLAIAVALFFIPAGRLDWWAGWRFLALFFTASLALYAWLRRRDPALVAERQQSGPGVERWDRVVMGFYTMVLLSLPIIAGLDAGRFGWSAPSLWVQILGWLLLAVALAIIGWTMAANTYLSEQVRIQEERGHQVVTGGPYRYVRHPMYVGVILALLGAPLALASLWALIPGVVCALLFVVRTALEDRTLREKLPGYQEYAGRVRYRLVPGVW
jgi:protein-S-isoprenylcysteine O-methyltransferase Ste14